MSWPKAGSVYCAPVSDSGSPTGCEFRDRWSSAWALVGGAEVQLGDGSSWSLSSQGCGLQTRAVSWRVQDSTVATVEQVSDSAGIGVAIVLPNAVGQTRVIARSVEQPDAQGAATLEVKP